MKKLLKKSLLVVAVLTSIVINAANINNVVVDVIDVKLIDLKLNNSDGDLKISVKDAYGELLHSEKFVGSYYSQKYDLNVLPVGDYYFEIEGQTKIKVMPFNVTDKGIDFSNVIESVYYKPTVRQNEDLVFITKIALNEENLSVILYDQQLNVVYKEELNGDVNLGKTLNLKKLKRGYYNLLMKSEGRIFEQKIYKK